MKIHVLKFNKANESPVDFQARANVFIESIGDVSYLHVGESAYSSDIYFGIVYSGQKKSVNQKMFLSPWLESNALEGVVNNALAGFEEQGLKAKFLNFVYTAKSPRCLAAFIVEGNPIEKMSPDVEQDTHDNQPIQTAKQDPQSDVSPKRRRKRKAVS